MPRYYIDTDDGDRHVHDDEGLDLADSRAAREVVLETLPDLARQKMPDGDRRTFTVSARDAGGRVVYVASLALVGEWRITPP